MTASATRGGPDFVIAAAQPPTEFLSTQSRLDYAAAAGRAASALGPALLVLPELFLSGYGCSLADPAGAARRDAATLERLRVIASREQIWVITGLVVHDDSGYGNACVAIDPLGRTVASYRKIHLFGPEEERAFEPGTRVPIFATPLGSTALAICYDVEQAPFMAFLHRRGAKAVLVPTANMAPYHQVPDVQVRARALENQLLIAYANFAGLDGALDLVGGSIIVGGDGAVLGKAGSRPAMVLCTVEGPCSPESGSQATEHRYRPDRFRAAG